MVPPAPSNRQFLRKVAQGPEPEAWSQGKFVLYWMQIHRRVTYNFALQHALHMAEMLQRPLLIYEGLRPDYPHASQRIHSFILDGMKENFEIFRKQGLLVGSDEQEWANGKQGRPGKSGRSGKSGGGPGVERGQPVKAPVHYLPFIPSRAQEAEGFLRSLCKHACAVVSDEFPVFIVPGQNNALANALRNSGHPASFMTVDANGIIPLAESERDPYSAYIFRKILQKKFARSYSEFPEPDPLKSRKKGYELSLEDLELPESYAPVLRESVRFLDKLSFPEEVEAGSIMESLAPSLFAASFLSFRNQRGADLQRFSLKGPEILPMAGTCGAGRARIQAFLDKMESYPENRNHPDAQVTSGLSPYLHFGKISIHEVVQGIFERYGLQNSWKGLIHNNGSKGYFPGPPEVDAFLDEAITWRETGYHFAHHRKDYAEFDSLPDWVQNTLREHASDPREHVYTLEELESAQTHDEIWNAAQRELLQTGRIHNYLRMLWGKKILEWTDDPKEALERTLYLNNQYSIDGRNPNSYSGVFWVFGRFDRPWQERPVFGKIRYMSSEQTRKKVKMKEYLKRFGAQPGQI